MIAIPIATSPDQNPGVQCRGDDNAPGRLNRGTWTDSPRPFCVEALHYKCEYCILVRCGLAAFLRQIPRPKDGFGIAVPGSRLGCLARVGKSPHPKINPAP